MAANRLWHVKPGRQRLLSWLGIAGAALALAIVALRIATGATLASAIGDAAFAIFFALIIFGLRVFNHLALPRHVRRMMAQNLALNDPIACSWDDEEIRFVGSNGTADLAWRRLHRSDLRFLAE